MATLTHDDENLPETHEIFYLNSNMIDNEPFYKNFTTIHNVSRHRDEEKQPLYPINDEYRTESFHFNKIANVNHQNSPKTINGYIFNLIQIVADIGYDSNSPFMHSPQNTINNSTLSNIITKLGGIPGPLINEQRSHIDEQYFQQSYPDIYQRSPSMIQCYPVNHMNNKTSQISRGNQADNITHPSLSIGVTPHQMDEERFRNKIHGMYGFDDGDTMSSLSSRCSTIDEEDSPSSDRSSTPVILKTVDNSKPKQQITIREYYRANELSSLVVNRSLSPSSQQTVDDNYCEQLTRNHQDLYNDQKPEIIIKPNPDEVIYKQSVSIRYLVPPTPPPPGPLIIREVLPPRASTPTPLIINQEQPAPPTPPPLILREAPPTPPPQQEAKIITKVLPQAPPPRQREITGHQTPLPAKPQSIIIEKWLPYKPAPPREVIYERVVEAPVVSEFQPGGIPIKQERRHPTDLYSKSYARAPIPVQIEQPTSVNYLENRQPSTFDQFARVTEQQLLELQQRVIKQLQTHTPWVVNQQQQQQQTNMYRPIPTQLTTPTLVINHPPIIRTTTTHVQRADAQPQGCCQPAFIYSSYT